MSRTHSAFEIRALGPVRRNSNPQWFAPDRHQDHQVDSDPRAMNLVGLRGLAPRLLLHPKQAGRYLPLSPKRLEGPWGVEPHLSGPQPLVRNRHTPAPDFWSAQQVTLLRLALIKRPFSY